MRGATWMLSITGLSHRDTADVVIDSGGPLRFSVKSASARQVLRQDSGMCANADQKAVFALPIDRVGQIKAAGRPTTEIFAHLLAVEPDGRAELCLADLQKGDFSLVRTVKDVRYQK